LRKADARVADDVFDAIGEILNTFTPTKMRKPLRTRRICDKLKAECSS